MYVYTFKITKLGHTRWLRLAFWKKRRHFMLKNQIVNELFSLSAASFINKHWIPMVDFIVKRNFVWISPPRLLISLNPKIEV